MRKVLLALALLHCGGSLAAERDLASAFCFVAHKATVRAVLTGPILKLTDSQADQIDPETNPERLVSFAIKKGLSSKQISQAVALATEFAKKNHYGIIGLVVARDFLALDDDGIAQTVAHMAMGECSGDPKSPAQKLH
jgi:hypothetical protein